MHGVVVYILCFVNTHECLKYKPGERSDKVVGAVGDIEDRNGKTVGLVSTGALTTILST